MTPRFLAWVDGGGMNQTQKLRGKTALGESGKPSLLVLSWCHPLDIQVKMFSNQTCCYNFIGTSVLLL